jgi:glycosyltransferase involved in cell wall biosynthesis
VKLIFVNRYFHPDHAATAQLLSDVAFHLAAEGAEVHVITSRGRYDDPDAGLPRREETQGVQIHRVSGTRFGRSRLRGRLIDYLSFHLMARAMLRRLAAPGDVIVVKTDPPLFAVTALPIARRRRAHLVNWLQDIFPEVAAESGVVSQSGLVYRMSRTLRDRALAGATVNVAVSEAMERHLAGLGVRGPSEGPGLRVIPNWSDGALVYPVPPDHNELRRSWGLSDQFVVGYSGNLGRAHEIDTIAGTLKQLRGHTDVTTVFIGGGSGYDALQNQFADETYATVEFRPYQPRDFLHLSLSAPDVHLVSLAPRMEGLAFASKLYGVLAAGRPVIFIGARDGEVPRLLRQADCGLAVEAGDPDGLTEAILKLKADPELRLAMGRRARALFERDYDKGIAVESWMRLLLRDLPQMKPLK